MERRPITSVSKYNNNKQNTVVFYKIWKKYNEIQLTKNKMDLNNRKITNHPPSLVQQYNCRNYSQSIVCYLFCAWEYGTTIFPHLTPMMA